MSREPEREQLALDPIACVGHRLCAELFPERIVLDDWGYPIVDPEVPADAARPRHPRGQGVPGAGAQAASALTVPLSACGSC